MAGCGETPVLAHHAAFLKKCNRWVTHILPLCDVTQVNSLRGLLAAQVGAARLGEVVDSIELGGLQGDFTDPHVK